MAAVEQERSGFSSWLSRVFEPIDRVLGPSREKHQEACAEDKELLAECVIKSPCYTETGDFSYCMQDGITKECKALRYNLFMCKRSQLFWAKAFTNDNARRV